jgi:hypothetical protein
VFLHLNNEPAGPFEVTLLYIKNIKNHSHIIA